MKKTTHLLLFIILLLPAYTMQAQVLKQIGERVKEKAKQRAEAKADQAIDKGLDKIEGDIDSVCKKKNNKKKNKKVNNQPDENADNGAGEQEENAQDNNNANAGAGNRQSSKPVNNDGNTLLKVDSKFDFVPGEKIVLLEDFSSYPIGDFPNKWNTNGAGEVVKITDGTAINYLKIAKEAIFYPLAMKPLPDEFTLECDLLCSEGYDYYSYEFAIGMTNAKDIKTQWNYFDRFGHGGENNSRVEMLLHPNFEGGKQGLTYFVATHKANENLRNNANQNQFTIQAGNRKVHISIWRQKQRVRIYLNDKKVWDIPTAFEANIPVNSIYFRNNGTDNDRDYYCITNIKLATGNPNTKQKLLTEGKFSTSNILFDVNSDKIKTESYGALKDIANVLAENTSVKVKITGHTDSDGDDAANLELSKKRAVAVKNYLSQNFNIEASRMETDGKGETQPAVKNDNAENKAQNRRVEFIKL